MLTWLHRSSGFSRRRPKPPAQAVARIGNAERAWIAYRDAYIEATYPAKDKQTAYGSKFATDPDPFPGSLETLFKRILTRSEMKLLVIV